MKRTSNPVEVHKIKTKIGQICYLIKQTISSWLILIIVYVLFNLASISIEKEPLENLNIFFTKQNIFLALFFCLLISFFYSLIKLISIKNRIRLDEKESSNLKS